jgi:hypothetical protein
MAYRPALNDVLESRFVTFDPSPPPQVGINTLRWLVTSIVAGGVTQQQIAAFLDGIAAADYKARMPPATSYRGVSVQKINPLPRVLAEMSIANAGIGTAAAGQTPTQVAALVKLATARAGKAFRGRLYMPFLPSAAILANGNLDPVFTVALALSMSLLIIPQSIVVGGATTNITPVIFHAKGYGTPPVGVRTTDVITGSSASPLLATIRRRGNYGRPQAAAPF